MALQQIAVKRDCAIASNTCTKVVHCFLNTNYISLTRHRPLVFKVFSCYTYITKKVFLIIHFSIHMLVNNVVVASKTAHIRFL